MNNLNNKFEKQKSSYFGQRWRATQEKNQDNEASLLIKKDLQIKRLQAELENERKRADNALKMLDSFRNSHRIEAESSISTQSEVSKRLKAEEELRKVKIENQKLKFILAQQIENLAQFQKDMQASAAN